MTQRACHPDTFDDMIDPAVKDQQRTSNLARVRDNQRRSRARRKEYLEGLETKLRECKQLGVEASAEIQAAARRVVDENKRLRQVLKLQGFTDVEIDSLLLLGQQPEESPQATSAGALEGMLEARKACQCDDSPSSSNGHTNDSTQQFPSPNLGTYSQPRSQQSPCATGSPPSQTTRPQLMPSNLPPSPTQLCEVPTTQSSAVNTSPFQLPRESQSQPFASYGSWPPQPSHSTAYDIGFDEPTGWLMNFPSTSPANGHLPLTPADSASVDNLSSHASVSSCVAAAHLIRTVRPDIELAELERELGCTNGGECKVPMTHVFSIMNRVMERQPLSS